METGQAEAVWDVTIIDLSRRNVGSFALRRRIDRAATA